MSFVDNIKRGVYNFNTLTNTENYKMGYYVIAFLFFILSYISQTLFDKPCYDLIAVFIRLFHHFIIYFIYFGFLSPANILYLTGPISFIAVCSWIICGNKCFLTMLENKICGYPKSRVYRDISYYISKTGDSYISKIRIYLCIILAIIISIRWYVYSRTTRVVVQGHRGARGHRPENTLSAFDFALQNGITTIEMDLHMTKDGELVIYHDEMIREPICRRLDINSESKIKEMTLNEISQYTCGTLKNPEFPEQVLVNEHIPTFLELISHIEKKYPLINVRMNVEIKLSKTERDSEEYVKLFAKKLVDILEKHTRIYNTIIQSFDITALNYVRELNANISTSYLVETDETFKKSLDVCLTNGFKIVSPYYIFVNKEEVEKFQNNGIQVIPWNVNTISSLRNMIDSGVGELITDYPLLIQEYLSIS